MNSKKIGIVTFFRGNYGSILQCFATCETLRVLGYSPIVIEKIPNRLLNRFRFVLRCLCHPTYIKTFLDIRKGSVLGGTRLSDVNKQSMNDFISSELPVVQLKESSLKTLGRDEDFIVFLSGSDQIWGGHNFAIDPIYFLRFAPKHKRIAWVPSFGTNDVAPYNRGTYRRYISQYSTLSVRESVAADIVSKLTGRMPKVLIDPVFLLTQNQWKTFAETVESLPYVLCFFLDRPSTNTMEQINTYCEKKHLSKVMFGPWNESYQGFKGEFKYGGPKEFVGLISNSYCVFTDSFHALSFSLILNTRFFVYHRNYAHGIDQSSRIRTLLDRVGMTQYFNPQNMNFESWDFTRPNEYFDQERKSMLEYLSEAINKTL